MKLVVGLGNPERPYVGTRHNVGYEVVDRVATRLGWAAHGEFDRLARSAFHGLTMDGLVELGGGRSEKVVLLKPLTYMNASGRSVQAALSFFQMAPQDLLVILDEMALPCGRIRLRSGGSDGGHNGLRDIQRALGMNQYPRLRLGIDAPPPFVPGKDYVLGRWTPEQRKSVDPAIDRAADAVRMWIEQGMTAAMNRFNAAEDDAKEQAD